MSLRASDTTFSVSSGLQSSPKRGRTVALAVFLSSFAAGCTSGASRDPRGASRDPGVATTGRRAIRLMVDEPPATMNPRHTMDAIGQRLQALVFRGLTRLDENMDARPDLAESWKIEDGGKRYRFRIGRGTLDRSGHAIDAPAIAKCLANYFGGERPSVHKTAFPSWLGAEAEGDDLVIRLSTPDPYLPKNVMLLRYFTFASDPDHPCRDPRPGDVYVSNGRYEALPWPERFETTLLLRPSDPAAPDLLFIVVRDETSRLFKMMNGDVDGTVNGFSPAKNSWLVADPSRGVSMVDRAGATTSYFAFNMKDPILAKREVRAAIAHAIDRESIVKNLLRGQATLASSFLVPTLAEAISYRPFAYDPAKSEALLDAAGYPRGKDGVRLRLRYKSTNTKYGLEYAQIFREMLGKVGIAVELDAVETSVFFASIRKGAFQMYTSRWVGVSDGSIYRTALYTGLPDNRVKYSDPAVDAWLDAALREIDPAKRKTLLAKVQEKMLDDLPYFPLWHWTNALTFRNTLLPPKPEQIPISGAYDFLAGLRFRE